jgi:hypothetical protein
MSKCVKCENTVFGIQEISPSGAQYKMYVVQCVVCQVPVGVTDYWNVGTLLKNQEKKIAELESKLSSIQNAVNQIARALNSGR